MRGSVGGWLICLLRVWGVRPWKLEVFRKIQCVSGVRVICIAMAFGSAFRRMYGWGGKSMYIGRRRRDTQTKHLICFG
jgi:hypothetical protein